MILHSINMHINELPIILSHIISSGHSLIEKLEKKEEVTLRDLENLTSMFINLDNKLTQFINDIKELVMYHDDLKSKNLELSLMIQELKEETIHLKLVIKDLQDKLESFEFIKGTLRVNDA